MADTLKEYSPNHQTLEQLAAASDQLNVVKDKLQRQQQAESEKIQAEQKGTTELLICLILFAVLSLLYQSSKERIFQDVNKYTTRVILLAELF